MENVNADAIRGAGGWQGKVTVCACRYALKRLSRGAPEHFACTHCAQVQSRWRSQSWRIDAELCKEGAKVVFEECNLGFPSADAEKVRLSYVSGDLTLQFIDWQEQPRSVRFEEVLGFAWQDELDNPEIRDDLCYRFIGSPWLARLLELTAQLHPDEFSHYKLCFNACGVLDVVCRKVVS